MATITYGSPTVNGDIQVSVESAESVPMGIPDGATAFVYQGFKSNGTDILRTAAAGKKLYVYAAYGTSAATGTANASVEIETTDGVYMDVVKWESPGAGYLSESTVTPIPFISFITGELRISAHANTTAYYTVWGYEL